METLCPKKIAFFFQLESYVDKTILNFYSFNKINDFVATHYPILFKPLVLTNWEWNG